MGYIRIIRLVLFCALCLALVFAVRQCRSYKDDYHNALSNVEAYQASASNNEKKILQYSMTVDALMASKDSIDRKIVELKDSLRIKNKTLQYAMYGKSVISKVDTVVITDTVFVEGTCIDTLITEPWYSLGLHLEYPSTIVANPKFTNEHFVMVNSSREYNKTPSKIFFIRWFQKKHTVVEVHVEDKNPYIENTNTKFIKILNGK